MRTLLPLAALVVLGVATLASGCHSAVYVRRPAVHRAPAPPPRAPRHQVETVYHWTPPPSSYWWHDAWHTYPHPGSCACYAPAPVYYGGYVGVNTYWSRPVYRTSSYRGGYRNGYRDGYRSRSSGGFRGRVVVGR